MSPIYSVVMPVYNAEKYLESAIGSVLKQTSDSEVEIILVNDGSRDGSGAICDRCAAENDCITVIHQVNQGVSAARNAGIAAARGQYVLFLDSDDRWEENLLAALDGFLTKQPDVIEFGHYRFSGSEIRSTAAPACMVEGVPGTEYVAQLGAVHQIPTPACWAAAYRRAFLNEQQLRFPMGVRYGEDFYFYMHCLKQAQSVYTVSDSLYGYRINETSVTQRPNPKGIQDVITVGAQMYRLFPNSAFADYYCMQIWLLEKLQRKDAAVMDGLLRENRDILKQVSGRRARLARALYAIFGWYGGAKALRLLSNAAKRVKG